MIIGDIHTGWSTKDLWQHILKHTGISGPMVSVLLHVHPNGHHDHFFDKESGKKVDIIQIEDKLTIFKARIKDGDELYVAR